MKQMVLAGALGVALLWFACSSQVDDLKSEHVSSNVTTTEHDGVVTATISSSATTNQVLVGSSSSTAAEVSVTFPPGSLAIDTEIAIGAATDKSSAVLAEIGVTDKVKAGDPVYIGPSTTTATVEVTKPLTISMPLPIDTGSVTGLADSSSKLILIYVIYVNGAWKSGLIPLTADNLQGAFLKQTFQGLGYFQIIYLSAVQAAKEVSSQVRPGLNSGSDEGDETDTTTDNSAAFKDYQGFYSGSVADSVNLTASGAAGNGKYCAMNDGNLKFYLSGYNILVYKVGTSMPASDAAAFDDGIGLGDIASLDPTSFTIAATQGTPSPAILDTGVGNSGVKYTSSDQSSAKVLKISFTGGFSNGQTRKLTGKLAATIGDTKVCEIDVSLNKAK